MIIGMTKKDQVDALRFAAKARGFDLSLDQARDVLDAVASVIRVGLEQEGKIRIDGLGTFTVQKRRPRVGRNPKTGEVIDLPASATIKFKPVPDLRASVEAKHA